MKRFTLAAAALWLAASAGLAQAADKVLNVGWGPYADVPQFSIALGQGYFKEEGLDVKLVPFQSGRDGFEALIGGQLDMNIMAEFPAVVGAMRKQPFGLMAVLSRYKASRIITTDAAAKSVADLAGKKIGLPVGTNLQFMVDEEAARAGIKTQVVNLTPPDLVPALLRGDVDAIATFASSYPGAKRTLGERYHEIPARHYASTFMVVGSKAFLDKEADAAARFFKALVRAEDDMTRDPVAAQEAVSRTVGKAVPLDLIKADWTNYAFKVTLDPDLIDLMVREGRWIADKGLVKNVEPSADLFRAVLAPGPLKAAAPARVTVQ